MFIFSLLNEHTLKLFAHFLSFQAELNVISGFFFIRVYTLAVLITLNFFTLHPWVAPGVRKLSFSCYNRELFMENFTEYGRKAQKVQRGKVSWKIIICCDKKIEKFSFFLLFFSLFSFPLRSCSRFCGCLLLLPLLTSCEHSIFNGKKLSAISFTAW